MLLTEPVNPVKGLRLAHGIPLRFNNICPSSGRQIQSYATTSDGSKQNCNAWIISECPKYLFTSGRGQASIKADAPYRPVDEYRLYEIKGLGPAREDHAGDVSVSLNQHFSPGSWLAFWYLQRAD